MQPQPSSYKGVSFTTSIEVREDDQWHGYGRVEIEHETVQVAGQPDADRTMACRNILLAIRRLIDHHTA